MHVDTMSGTAEPARKPNWWLATPLIFTTIPLVRHALRHNPKLRDRVFIGMVAAGVVHGFTMMAMTGEEDKEKEEEKFVSPHQIRRMEAASKER